MGNVGKDEGEPQAVSVGVLGAAHHRGAAHACTLHQTPPAYQRATRAGPRRTVSVFNML